ncbi:MAG: integrase arm-type DNA-binding domain-containing protein [Alphaproteobacteria bacterium]
MPRGSAKHLTDPGIGKMSKAKKGKRDECFDAGAPGLALRITDKGVKSWSVYCRLDGKHQRLTIGAWPEIGVAKARDQAREIKSQAKAGIDPKEAGKAEKAAAEDEAADTFGAIAEEYIKIECLERELRNGKVLPPKLKRGWEVERIIRRELMPHWQDQPLAELRKRDAIKRTEALVDDGRPAAAHRLHEIIRRIGRWAARRDKIDLNPFADMDPPAPKVIRDRYLRPDEIKAVWKAWDAMGYPFGPLGKLLLVTAQRLNEVAQMQWIEIDRDNALWIIPADRTKSGRESEVSLSSLALEVLEALPRFTEADFVFTTTSGRRPVSGFSKMKARTDTLVLEAAREQAEEVGKDPESVKPMPPWRLHDLRRSARTGLAELGVPQIVAEKVLGHAERNVLVKTYDRHEYAAEKRDALERWALRLREITEPPPENVVKLKAAR